MRLGICLWFRVELWVLGFCIILQWQAWCAHPNISSMSYKHFWQQNEPCCDLPAVIELSN